MKVWTLTSYTNCGLDTSAHVTEREAMHVYVTAWSLNVAGAGEEDTARTLLAAADISGDYSLVREYMSEITRKHSVDSYVVLSHQLTL